jgi:glycine cleavage system H protein
MSLIPETLKYTKEHEWAKIEGNVVTVGITDFAQSSLGDIVFVELPAAGSTITKGKTFGVVESIKSVSDLYAPITGKVLARNDSVIATPESLNQDAYSSWMLKIEMQNPSDAQELLSAADYTKICQ